jgi:hypothetical protein
MHIFDAMNHGGTNRIRHFENYFISGNCFNTIDEETWVKRDCDFLTAVVSVDIIFDVAGLMTLGGDLHVVFRDCLPNR